MNVRPLLALAAPLLIVAAAGCSNAKTVTVPVTAKKVSITTRDELLIDLGEVDPAAGQSWSQRGQINGKALLTYGDKWVAKCKLGAAGCVGHEYWDFAGNKAGVVTLRFQYCVDSSGPNCHGADPKKVSPEELIVVTVY